jgi:hypothetical protein
MRRRVAVLCLSLLIPGTLACGGTLAVSPDAVPTRSPAVSATTTPPRSRSESIPAARTKGSPEDDPWPPVAAEGWSRPVPLAGPVNTAGAEDSPFILPDGNTLYFFFTPDLNIPAQEQLFDGVTGIWVSRRTEENWSEPERVVLEEAGEPALDACAMVIGDRLYFCSARVGNKREIDWYYATRQDGGWRDVRNAGEWLNGPAEVGELHITAGYRDLYFASRRAGGQGGFDLWVSHATPEGWGEPENLGPQVNTSGDENQPFVTADGEELWFTAPSRSGKPGPSVYRCLRRAESHWDDCREIVSSFAGEPTLTGDGRTLYFVHHFLSSGMAGLIEADIYISYRTP